MPRPWPVPEVAKYIFSSATHTYTIYRIAGKFGREKVRQIDPFRAFGERKFGKLIDQPIGYQL